MEVTGEDFVLENTARAVPELDQVRVNLRVLYRGLYWGLVGWLINCWLVDY